jgi:SRSO17 transposase
MVGRTSDWKEELGRFLKPFLHRLGHKARRQMCPLYVSGLIGPGDRKSIQPMAERLGFGEYDQLHHFIAAGAQCVRSRLAQSGVSLRRQCLDAMGGEADIARVSRAVTEGGSRA